MRIVGILTIFVLLLSQGGSAYAEISAPPKAPVAGRALSALFPGKFEVVWKGKRKLLIGADAQGGLKAYVDGKYDTGRWEIRDGRLCISFTVWTSGDRKCGEVYRAGGWYVALIGKDGRPDLMFRRQ